MVTNFLKWKMIQLGFHIGHFIVDNHYNSKFNNQFLDGTRNSYKILNINFIVFFLQKSIFFLKNINNSFGNVLFFSSSFEENTNLNLLIKLFLRKKLFFQTGISFIHLKWIHGLISNYNYCFFRFIKFIVIRTSILEKNLKMNRLKKKKTRYLSKLNSSNLFLILFFKIFYLLEERLLLDEDLDLYKEVKKMSHLFRLIIFLRFWKSFFWIPDALLSINSKNINSPFKEFSTLKIPVSSVCDSVTDYRDISYPILLNDDSILSLFFLSSLISNVFKKDKLSWYNYL